jgi:hypothetical protein
MSYKDIVLCLGDKMKHSHYTLRGFPVTGKHYCSFCLSWWKHYFNPVTYFKAIKYFCQRGWRGYASCDYWDADSYFENVMLGVIKDLREHAHGYPESMADYGPGEDVPEGVEDTGFERWKAVLTEIIEGLEASQELRAETTVPKGVYSDEPFEWEPVEDNPDLMRLKETDTPRFNKELWEQWADPLRKKQRRAMHLLAKHWGSFWD